MSFTRLIGQEAVKKRLAQEITGNPCHASVFTGVKGIGKHEFAHEYAKALLCSEPTSDGACGHCNNRCPFSVDQMSRMKGIGEYFGG